ncbi:hypothetical protein OMP38_27195 [Cohnella ginsengisoli]|uniref:Uncharacterized protein n=1 Tax=Cohnella ginsengisoli TaxID=425004 RepID=A0A9X4QPN8_9BACL|nr:hypothetical protein [Cohnella ginsengisoli]MDG0794103.1 hypothetical protein [Cohnella ginsengisoli]
MEAPIRYGSNEQFIVQEKGVPLKLSFVRGMGAPQSELYFPLSERPGAAYTMKIPEISVAYHDEATVKLPVDSVENLNKTFKIAGYPVTITKTELIASDRLRIYTDFHTEERPDRMLYNLYAEGNYMAKLSERTGAYEYMEVNVKPGTKTVNLTFSNPTAVLRGPWVFEWSSDEIQP